MTVFYTNKYPLSLGMDKEGNAVTVEVGAIFTLKHINFDQVELEPIEEIPTKDMNSWNSLIYSIAMLEFAFKKSNSLSKELDNHG